MKKTKKGQITIFIILALAIVVVLILLFIGRNSLVSIISEKTPVQQIRECMQEPIQTSLDKIDMQGGSFEPKNYFLYQGNKVEYLCYTEENFKPCVMQKPLLKQSIEKELETYLQPRARDCLESVKSSLERKGYSVAYKNPILKASLIPNNIIVEIESDLTVEKSSTETYKTIKIDFSSSLYNLVMITSSILNWEARYGTAETMNYMIYYPSIKVEKKKQSEGTTIYILTDRNSLDKFMFASRSYVIVPGLTGQ
ncbi:MAG: hypothetical protein PHH54_02925 [Candidatus Nanoarchaeia archaeon]|nr:hypothetical protein [Candidatus Nanoarchaeia archaeon]MDD5740913.1 hypothetical protein [Candidatus Nanoarchaeia archaeon]